MDTRLTAQVISLPHRYDRRGQFAQHAHEQGITYFFVEGIVPADPTNDAQVRAAINAAHRACIVRARLNAWPYALVMEDDCFFPAADGYGHFLRHWDTEADVYTGGLYTGTPDADGHLTGWCGMHCYIVHQRFYDRFLEVDPTDHIDVALAKLGGRYRCCVPYAALQRSGYSDQLRKATNYGNAHGDKVYRG